MGAGRNVPAPVTMGTVLPDSFSLGRSESAKVNIREIRLYPILVVLSEI